MKKKISLNYETVKGLFDPTADSEDGDSYFRVNGGSTPISVLIPTSVMHRLFRLGQAYGINQLKFLESEVKIIIGSVDVPRFVHDLHKLHGLVNDEVVHEYVNELLAALEAPPGIASKSIAVSTGSYYETREKAPRDA